MGEQSTSWTVDLAWTGQVEEHRMEVDTADVADINVQPGNTSDQRPSSASDMPPITRSHGSRSRAPTLGTLPEEGAMDPSVQGSGKANPRTPEEQRTGATPQTRRITLSISRAQRADALETDPNHGRCLLTNRQSAVQLCHVIAVATEDETLTQLEYVWGIRYGKFDLHTARNLMHLRADWHFLFDQAEWVLIPELEVLQKLNKIYVEDKQATSNLAELFPKQTRTYNYYVLPTPGFQEPICRFLHANGTDGQEQQEHETHFPPFPHLGPLQSHILPHYVIFNTGSKLDNMKSFFITDMIVSLTRVATLAPHALSMFAMIQHLYKAWTDVKVPDHFNAAGTSNRSNSRSEAGQDDAPQSGARPRREGLRSGGKSQEQGSQASGGGYAGGQQRAIHPFQPSEDDESVTDDTVVDDSTDWIEYIHKWRNEDDGATEEQKSNVVNEAGDEQLAAYIGEHARTPPSPGAWNSWKSDWDDSKSRYPTASDRSRFSSNDWAVFKNDVYLTRPGYPQATV